MRTNTWFVYWIPHPLHKHNENEGYVGVTQNVEKRFESHTKSRQIVGKGIRKHQIVFEEVEILFEGSRQEAYTLENTLRPEWRMGWNITPGGDGYLSGHRPDQYIRAAMSSNKKKRGTLHPPAFYAEWNKDRIGVSRPKELCPFCEKEVSVGNSTRWHFANCKEAPKQHTFINGFDIDGVIYLGPELNGVYPGEQDVIITGRSIDESEYTLDMLQSKGIRNNVYFNPIRFEEKSRESSAEHKASTIIELFKRGITVRCMFEDDWVQLRIQQKLLKKFGLKVNSVWMNHGGLVNLENQWNDDRKHER